MEGIAEIIEKSVDMKELVKPVVKWPLEYSLGQKDKHAMRLMVHLV